MKEILTNFAIEIILKHKAVIQGVSTKDLTLTEEEKDVIKTSVEENLEFYKSNYVGR